MIHSLPRQGQILCIELGIELKKKDFQLHNYSLYKMSVNYFVVYTPALSLSHQIIMDFPASHMPVKYSGPEDNLHTCSSVLTDRVTALPS